MAINIPLLNRLGPFTRFALVAGAGLFLLAYLIYLIVRPTAVDSLTQSMWCVDRIYFNGKPVGPKSKMFVAMLNANGDTACYENLTAEANHRLTLPGINSSIVSGTWVRITNDSIKITADTLQQIYNGNYSINAAPNNLTLTSKTTVIYMHRDRTAFPLPF